MAGKSLEQRVADYDTRIRQLEAQRHLLAQQVKVQARKERTRQLIQIGGIMARLGIDTVEKAQALQRIAEAQPKVQALFQNCHSGEHGRRQHHLVRRRGREVITLRRCVGGLVFVILLLITATGGVAQGQSSLPIRVFVDGTQVSFPDQLPVIVDGRTLVPLRGVFEQMGATVDWDNSALRATVKLHGTQVAVFVGSRTAWVNGSQRTLDVAARIIGGRVMIPLRFIAKSIGQQVNWDQQQQAVIIGARPSMPVLAPYGDPNMEMPCTLRVAIRGMGKGEPLTSGPYTVRKVDLADYVANVLAHEFGDFTENKVAHQVPAEALKAGAVAVMMYGWYYSWHPTKPDYDLDNSTNAQVYMPGTATERYRDAVRAVWGTIMVRNDSEEVIPPQHGQGHFDGGGKDADWMSQRGSAYLASKGYTWQEILRYYYPDSKLIRHPNPCAGL